MHIALKENLLPNGSGHLKNVVEMSRSFAETFGAGDWGSLAWLWHDLGKEINGFLC